MLLGKGFGYWGLGFSFGFRVQGFRVRVLFFFLVQATIHQMSARVRFV